MKENLKGLLVSLALTSAVLLLIRATAAFGVAPSNARLDDNGNPTLIVDTTGATGTVMRVFGDTDSGAMNVMIMGGFGTNTIGLAPKSSFEMKVCTIAASVATACSPSATSSIFWLTNESASNVRVALNSTATAASGIMLSASGTMTGENLGIGIISIFNLTASQATVSINFGR